MTQRESKAFIAAVGGGVIALLIIFGIDPRSPLLWLLLGFSGGLGIGVLDFHVKLSDRKEKESNG